MSANSFEILCCLLVKKKNLKFLLFSMKTFTYYENPF
jgi:hypothetical protein